MVNRNCTAWNKGKQQTLTLGEIQIHVNVQGKKAPIKVTLTDVLWIHVLPCQLLSIRTGVTEENVSTLVQREATFSSEKGDQRFSWLKRKSC